ncbi:gliding motility-associated-like protein [Algoriphagus aquaeductus]|uniref:Gliding motility-associated-like protein n=1 Tax=Algoriphagus aquaeductus TaxID=475299 RepID=A0A326RP80_9BACT|nr:MBG domain-containing protein [Algoriphagus aquaeductus]PZV82154.1 gliding motility-associated-like protein [Algoriphagus aquaeductus]
MKLRSTVFCPLPSMGLSPTSPFPFLNCLTSVFRLKKQGILAGLLFILTSFFQVNAQSSTLSFDDQGLTGCQEISDNHSFSAFNKTFFVFAANFDGTPSENNTPKLGEGGVTQIADGTGVGSFSEAISGLSSSSTYYHQAYATNSVGTSYVGVESFVTTVLGCAPAVGVTDFEGLYTSFTQLASGTGSATATVECFDFTSVTIDPTHTARVSGTSISGNELLIIQGVGTSPNANLARAIIKSNDNREFSFKSIKVQPFGSFTDWDITYQGYKDGSLVTGASLSRNNMISGTMYTDDFTSISGFSNVDEIRIEFSVVGTSFQNFRIDDLEIGPAASFTSPTLTTSTATSITSSEATLNGNVTSDGGAAVTARGFVYSSSDNTPTLGEGGVIQVADGLGTGTFSEAVSGLSSSTTYYYQAYATNSQGTSYGGVVSFETLTPNDDTDPVLILPADANRNTDLDECSYTVQGTEFDPITATDNSGSLASLTYSLQKLLPSPDLISEDFNSGAWNPANFEIGSPTGGVVSGAYRSTGGGDDRGTLRTVADFIPTAENPVYVTATLRFAGTGLAFIGTRSTGLKNTSSSNEPTNSLYFRIHNFNNGQTNLSSTSFDGRPGNSFYSNPVIVSFVDNGTNITGTFTNTVTQQVLSFNQNTNYSSGSWRVVFSGGAAVSWDDIKISFGPHEYIQEYASGSNSLAGIELERGEITIEWTAADASGNETVKSQLVTVEDNQEPFISGLANLSGESESSNNWQTTIPDVVFGDNCSGSTLSWQMSGAHTNSGLGQVGTFSFAPGNTTITYKVTDASGNTTSGAMTVENTKEFFAGGAGTESDPYQISNWQHLYNIRFFSGTGPTARKYFVLTNDLDASSSGYENYASETANEGLGWEPGGYVNFIVLDGKGFEIADLNINRPTNWENGIFRYLYYGVVKNIVAKDFVINGRGNSGFFAGYVDNLNFENIQVINGNLTSMEYYGGLLAGGGYNTTILNSSVKGVVSGKYYLGGFLGELYEGKIESSFANVSISGRQSLGGLVGYYESYGSDLKISKSYAKGIVSGTNYIGGLVGQGYYPKIHNSYSEVAVTGTSNYVGGIIGYSYELALTNSYAFGSVVGMGLNVGGLTGIAQQGTITQSFWDKTLTGQEENQGGGTGLLTAELKEKALFLDAEWDFDTVWNIKVAAVDGGYISYPYLRGFTYDIPGTDLEVNPIPGLERSTLPQTITFPEIAEKTYGDATFTLGNAETDQGLTVTYTAADPTVVSITGNQAFVLKAGSTTITASQAGDDSRFPAENIERTLTVGKKALTITAKDDSKTYGTAYTFAGTEFTTEGLTNEDAVTSATITSTGAPATAGVNTYDILISEADGTGLSNYEITYEKGTLTVGKKALTITANSDSKSYGDTYNFEGTEFTTDGLEEGDAVTSVTLTSTGAPATATVNTYDILISEVDGTGLSNYEITYEKGTLTVGKKALTITANSDSKTYGDTYNFEGTEFTTDGLEEGDAVTSVTLTSTGAPATATVNTYDILISEADGTGLSNYEITYEKGTLTVGKKALTITANSDSKTYGDTYNFEGTEFTTEELEEGDAVTSVTLTSTGAPATATVNAYDILISEAEGTGLSNYEITYEKGTLTVGKKALTITANSDSKTYGTAYTFAGTEFTTEGLTNEDAVTSATITSTGAPATATVNTYDILISEADGPGLSNYEITYEKGTLTVGKKAVTITADDKSKTYGEANPALTFTYNGLVNGDTQVATEPGISTTATQSSNAGTYPITLMGGEDQNYTITLVNGTLTVDKKALTITADDKQKTYGEANPALTITYDGLVNGDTQVATEPGISTMATQSSNAGTYPITLTGGSDDNYTITLVNGTLTVDKKAVTITADDKSKTYGEANPALTFTYNGLVNGDTQVATEPGISTTATQSSNAGSYPITLAGGEDQNYTITLVNGTLTVDKKALTITADDKQKTYGEANPALTFTYNGLVNGDTKVATEPGIITTATQSSNVGIYPITLAGGEDQNYNIILVNGILTIGKKDLTITANDKSKTYGEANPALTFTYDGLVNGDTKVTIEPSISTTATRSSNAGTYPITLAGGEDQNYTITLVNGTLTIGKKDLTITADDKSKTYGEENPALTFSYDGLVNGETKVATEPGINTTATQSSNAGTYPITLTSGEDQNYTITLVNGTLTIGKKDLTITANDKSKTYGEANPPLTFTYDGLVNGDTKVATEPGISTTATQSSNVGTYPITLTGSEDQNYTITLVNGTLTIGKALLKINAEPKSKIFGNVDPVLTFTVTGFKLSDTEAILSGGLERVAGETVGVYAINQGTLAANANYQIEFVGSDLEILPATLAEILSGGEITTPWSVDPTLPGQVDILTQDGQILRYPVVWDRSTLNLLKRGTYTLFGTVNLPAGILNPAGQKAVQRVIVLPKANPQDLLLSNNTFAPAGTDYFVAVGAFLVIDPVDRIHTIELIPGQADNAFFEIKSDILFWSSSDEAAGRTEFTVQVRVTDRDGNILEKSFRIQRVRKDLSELTVYNSFTPDGDGVNDTWGLPDMRFFTGARVQVFDRDGRRVFYTEDADIRWNGTFEGKELPTGAYIWVLETRENGESRRGILNLIRK